ncbi:ATP-binding protein [Aliihoeflea sp. 40Bstr573]|uniref:ATP-binding protein n=1 Tax=Aliihoeflea sp. 40Bstr573 TaxID=2696467 RepID=UPI002095DDCA|nr:ATP-binding protein [Aliihoeflea sp. 40Bstr573]MCO6388456.1 GAF domain-containing protein [Aliihoeflea sp. 40Bstr573]
MNVKVSTDLDLCAQEPIRIPGGIQPHGALIVLDADLGTILQASANAPDFLGFEAKAGARIDAGPLADALAALKQNAPGDPFLKPIEIGEKCLLVSAHGTSQGVIVEFEETDPEIVSANPYPRMQRFVDRIESSKDIANVLAEAAGEVRALTGFNRVMIYRFDADWNGTVIAEDGDGVLPSYLDLRFPATDIPAQARELYKLNRLRLIPSSSYDPVPIEPVNSPVDGEPLDLSDAALRSVSPIHLEYMRNMGTGASMSISLIIDGALWGLISCHNRDPKEVDARIRAACEFLGRIVGHQIAFHERRTETSDRLALKRVETELVSHLARTPVFQEGLVARSKQWLKLTNAEGAAVVTEGVLLTAGQVPSTARIKELARWLHQSNVDRIFVTRELGQEWTPGRDIADVASGVLAVPISQRHASFIIWFRPELKHTVKWGGEPAKNVDERTMRISPRTSFEIWKETVRGRSVPWSSAELHSAEDFRQSVVDLVLQRAEERAELTEELQRSNKELEAFSYSISHDLRAPFRHIAGYAQLLKDEEPELKELSRHYIEGISQAAVTAGQLVDDLLQFSQLGRTGLKMSRVDMNKVVEEIQRGLSHETERRRVEWKVDKDLPVAWGDPSLMRQAMFNLVENAVKYSRDSDPSVITITGGRDADGSTRYSVADNGVGFDMSYVGKLFQVFQRLHHSDEFDGTGIGLALTKRIIDRHGGSISAEGTLGKGAMFTIELPDRKGENERGKLETDPAG